MPVDGASLYRVPFYPSIRVKYYLTDFGLSGRYEPEERPPLEPAVKGAPECMVRGALCDPFPTDVYCLENLVKKQFLEGGKFKTQKLGFEFMRLLVMDMIQTERRSNKDEVVQRFNEIVHGLSSWKLRAT